MPVTEKTYPEWVQAYRARGTTVKKKGDAYYLYKRTSKRVPGKKYPQPVDTYIGLITPEGIVKSGKRKIDITEAEVWEFGFSKALLKARQPHDEKTLHCSLGAQFGLLSRRIYKEHGVDVRELEALSDIYLICMDGHEIVSRITEGQRALMARHGIHPEVD